MNLKEIRVVENLSNRTYNVCYDNGLFDIKSICEFYKDKKSFNSLKNCGKRSNEELINISKKYIVYSIGEKENNNNENIPKDFNDIFNRLNSFQIEIIDFYIKANLNLLGAVSIDILKKTLNNKIDLVSIIEYNLLSENYRINPRIIMRNKSIGEFEIFLISLKDFILTVYSVNDYNSLINIKHKCICQTLFSDVVVPIEVISNTSIFTYIDYFIKNNLILNNIETNVLQNSFKLYKDKYNLNQENDLSLARIQQIRKKILLKYLPTSFLFLKYFEDDIIGKYQLVDENSMIFIDEFTLNKINIDSNTNFTKEFVVFLIYNYYIDKFDMFGNIEDVLMLNSLKFKNKHKWKNFYLIKKDIFINFNLELLLDDLNCRFNEKIEETYSFNFKSYLSNFFKNSKLEINNTIYPIIEKIINKEFDVSLDQDENIVFLRKTSKPINEYVIEFLESNDKPCFLEDIYLSLSNINPGLFKSIESLRSCIQRCNEITYIGRSSTYALKKWEKEKNNFKGGTIRSIVIEFLEKNSNPQDLTLVVENVLRYRPDSNQKSIITNLKVDESNNFIFYKNNLIGLKHKKYSKEYEPKSESDLQERLKWKDKYNQFENFILNNKRLPRSNARSEDEVKLYRWMKLQNTKIKHNKMDNLKANLLNKLYRELYREL